MLKSRHGPDLWQQHALDDLGPREVSCGSLSGFSQSPFPAQIVFERAKEADKFLWVIGLHH